MILLLSYIWSSRLSSRDCAVLSLEVIWILKISSLVKLSPKNPLIDSTSRRSPIACESGAAIELLAA